MHVLDDPDAIYRKHAPAAFRRAERLLGAPADAHEVVHDVFLSLIERPEQYAGRSSMTTFLYSAVTHACLKHLRNTRNRLRLVREHGFGAEGGASAPDQPERDVLLRQTLTEMPDELAHPAVLYYVDELTHDEIACVLGCSRRHVGDLLERAQAWTARWEAKR